MSSGGGDTTTTTSNEPPAWMKPYIQDVLKSGQSLYRNYDPQYYPYSTVAPMSPHTQRAITQMGNFGGSSFNQSTMGTASGAQQTLAGMGQNPGLQAGTQQIGSTMPFLDFLRARAVGQQPDMFAGAAQGQQLAASGPQTPQTSFEQQAQGVNPTGAIQGTLDRAPGQNPYIDELVQRSLAANTRDFNQNAMPQIANAAQAAGGYGGSRQGIAEGVAMQGLADANARTAAQLYSNAYSEDLSRQLQAAGLGVQMGAQGAQTELSRIGMDRNFGVAGAQLGGSLYSGNQDILNAGYGLGLNASDLGLSLYGTGQQGAISGSQGALALAPGLQGMGLVGPQAAAQAGEADFGYNQALLNDMVNRFNFYQMWPYEDLQRYAGIVQGNAAGYGTQTTTAPAGGSGGLAGAMGGAAMGAGLANMAWTTPFAGASLGPAAGLVALAALGGFLS